MSFDNPRATMHTTRSRTTKTPAAPARRQYGRPNYFVGFRITSPEIISNVQQLQQQIATQFPEVERCLIDARTLHVTLCTLHLETEDDLQLAQRIFAEHALVAGVPAFGQDAPTFDFRGVDFFGKNFILYGALDVSSTYFYTLAELAEAMHRAFDAVELTTGPFKKPYTPHITIWKTTKFITYVKQLNRQRAVPIEYALGDYLERCGIGYLGSESPTTIELLSMREKEEDGYYKVCGRANLIAPATQADVEEGLEEKAPAKSEDRHEDLQAKDSGKSGETDVSAP